jgi:signal transduction histidine kinase
MVEQNLPLQEPPISEVAAALIDLAQLAQTAGSAAFDTLGMVADKMLRRLLVLFEAQRGAVLIGMEEYVELQQHTWSSSSNPKVIRALALHGIREEETSTLLTTFPSADIDPQDAPDLSCWITYRLSIGGFMAEREWPPQHVDAWQNRKPSHIIVEEVSQDHSKQPLHALLVLGWTGENDGECAVAVERGHRLLPYIAEAAGAVIVSILMAERIHELESTAVREALHGMELLKAELLGTVSHELRSPLASVKGYAATLLRHERRLSREERHQFLLAINEASDRLELVIERLLEMSQLETGEVTISLSPVDVAHLTAEAIAAIEERVSELLPSRFIFKLRLENADGTPARSVPLILADQRRLREVLDNLLENAVKYSPGGGVVKVVVRPVTHSQTTTPAPSFENNQTASEQSVHATRPMLEILVYDTGMGIPVEHLERIFDRFHRVDTRLTREVNGLGLGLAICKRIVELHDGIIWAENRADEKGSVFHVRLPIDEIPNV